MGTPTVHPGFLRQKSGITLTTGVLAVLCAIACLFTVASFIPIDNGQHVAQARQVIGGTVEKGATAGGSLNNRQETESQEVGDIAASKPDGVYYGTGEGFKSEITVAATVKDGKITDIQIVSQSDDASYFNHATSVIQKIIDYQRTDVNTMTGATYSSKGILSAVDNAFSDHPNVPLANQAWFGYLMLGLALACLVIAILLARRQQKAADRRSAQRASQGQRLATQVAFFILAPSSFATAFSGAKYFFSKMNIAQQSGSAPVFELNAFVCLLIATVAFTVVFGRFFCGYICSFGLMQDLLFKLRQGVLRLVAKARHTTVKRSPKMPSATQLKVERALRLLKYVVLVIVLAIVLMGYSTFLNDNSPWVVFGQLSNLSTRRITELGLALLAIIVVGSLFKERFFCEFLCPLGAIYSIIPTLPTGRMNRDDAQCLPHCKQCLRNCPVHIEPTGRLLAGECVQCGKCESVCPVQNVVTGIEPRVIKGTDPAEAQKIKAPLIARLSARPVAMLIQTVIMLVIFLLIGEVRFLPTL